MAGTTGLRLTVGGTTLDLAWHGPRILRLRAWRDREPARESLFLRPEPAETVAARVVEDAEALTLTGGGLGARVRRADLRTDLTIDGRLLLRLEHLGFPASGLPGEDAHGAEAVFRVGRDAPLVGCGQVQDGRVDRRGSTCDLIQSNFEAVVPVLVSGDGWGLLWHNASHTRFAEQDGTVRWWSEVADGVDCWIAAGRDAQEAIGLLHTVAGRPPQPPRWALGFFQSKERYHTAAEVLEVVGEFRRRGLPLDCIVQDWAYWGRWQDMHRWSSMTWDAEVFGDLPGLVRAVHEVHHARLMISVWPNVGVGSALERELTALGATWSPGPRHWMGDGKVILYDAFDATARETYWRHARDGLLRHGIDAWWMDATEPEADSPLHGPGNKASLATWRPTAAGSWSRVLNGFVTPHVRQFYEGQRQAEPGKRVFILTRSAFLGSSAAGAATWSGDISASWPVFRRQIAAGLSAAAAGVPWWTTDCGAFFTGEGMGGHFTPAAEACRDPAYRELYLRWFQFSCFSPLMRSHGTNTPREPWRFGEAGSPFYDGQREMLRLRYRLLPYLAGESARIAEEGGSLLRPLALEFPGDAGSAQATDQYLFGPSLLVAPVTRPFLHPPAEDCELLPQGWTSMDEGRPGWRLVLTADGRTPKRRHVAVCDQRWGDGRHDGAGTFTVQAETRVTPDRDGRFTVHLRSDGEVRLEVDGREVIAAPDAATERVLRAEIDLRAGQTQTWRLSYRNAGSQVGRLRLGLEGPGLPAARWELPAPAGRDVHLPPGTWCDFWTGERHAGGRTVHLPAPLTRLPLLLRAGAILPLGPDQQWTGEKPADPIELRIVPGADGRLVLREDAGDGYGYERGECSRIEMRWDDASQVLSMAAREGAFPGMLDRRTFQIVRVGPGRGLGIAPTPVSERCVVYDGSALRVSLG